MNIWNLGQILSECWTVTVFKRGTMTQLELPTTVASSCVYLCLFAQQKHSAVFQIN